MYKIIRIIRGNKLPYSNYLFHFGIFKKLL